MISCGWVRGVCLLVGVSLLAGCASGPCVSGDAQIRRNGAGWCQGGRRLSGFKMDSLLSNDSSSAGAYRAGRVMESVGMVSVGLPSLSLMYSMLTLGSVPATPLAVIVGGGVVGFPLLLIGGVQQHKAIEQFNCARSDDPRACRKPKATKDSRPDSGPPE